MKIKSLSINVKPGSNKAKCKPFLKWAGGKTQLLEQFENYYPIELKNGILKNYYEPFLGSAAVYFSIIQKYNIENVFLSDINEELILTYNVVQKDIESLIDNLTHFIILLILFNLTINIPKINYYELILI